MAFTVYYTPRCVTITRINFITPTMSYPLAVTTSPKLPFCLLSPHHQPLTTSSIFSISIDLPVRSVSMVQNAPFCDWLLSLSIIYSKLIHVLARVFHFFSVLIIFHCKDLPRFNHLLSLWAVYTFYCYEKCCYELSYTSF